MPLPSSFHSSPLQGWAGVGIKISSSRVCWLHTVSAEGRHHPHHWAGLGALGKLGKPRVKLRQGPAQKGRVQQVGGGGRMELEGARGR